MIKNICNWKAPGCKLTKLLKQLDKMIQYGYTEILLIFFSTWNTTRKKYETSTFSNSLLYFTLHLSSYYYFYKPAKWIRIFVSWCLSVIYLSVRPSVCQIGTSLCLNYWSKVFKRPNVHCWGDSLSLWVIFWKIWKGLPKSPLLKIMEAP